MGKVRPKFGIVLRPLPVIVLAAFCAVVFGSGLFYAGQPLEDLKEKTFAKLARVRDSKKEAVITYFNSIHRQAFDIHSDSVMRSYFDAFLEKSTNALLEYKLDEYCINQYGGFYDILFVDAGGTVFHSLRKESDYRTNLFNGRWSATRLACKLKASNADMFVEYEFYEPSDEPAAFFVVAFNEGEKRVGWIILQSAINQVNTILSDCDSLGRTGEVYLVNRDRLMLTDSRFMEDSTILKLNVNTLAVKKAMAIDRGERILEDYRGVRVFSSFEKFRIFGTEWIIIAEIDEDEVLSDHYRRHRQYFLEQITTSLSKSQPESGKNAIRLPAGKRVDINEFAQAKVGQWLNTYGVAACTAVAIHYPDRFSYLAHISPSDALYSRNWVDSLWPGQRQGNFLDGLIQRIRHYRVYPHELKNLSFTIVAPHTESIGNAVDTILANGVEITNISFVYNPSAIGANIALQGGSGEVLVQWYNENSTQLQTAATVKTMGALVQQIAGQKT